MKKSRATNPTAKTIRRPLNGAVLPAECLRAGVGRADITPPQLGRPMLGYADPDRKSERIRDRLHATTVVFDSEAGPSVLISLDVLSVDQPTTAAIRQGVQEQTGIEGSRVMVHPIQTHSGPCTQNIWGWGDRDDEYVFGTLVPSAIATVVQARKSMVPVRIGIGCTRSDVGINRRATDADGNLTGALSGIGLHDPHLTVARIETARGLLANLVHYGAHPTVFGEWSRAVSRDWPGILIDRMEELTKAPTLFFGGATGDVAPRTNALRLTGDQSEAALWETGARAAWDAMDAWRSIKDIRVMPVRTIVRTIDLPYRPLPPLDEARQRVAEFAPQKDSYGTGMCEYKHWSAVLEAHARPLETAYHHPVVATAIGPLAMVPLPGEVFAETSLRLRHYSPFQHTLVASLTDNCLGYFFTRESLARGGYEPWVNRAFSAYSLADGIDDVLVRESLRVLAELHREITPAWPVEPG